MDPIQQHDFLLLSADTTDIIAAVLRCIAARVHAARQHLHATEALGAQLIAQGGCRHQGAAAAPMQGTQVLFD